MELFFKKILKEKEMKEIKILGTGCAKCIKLEEESKKAAEEMNIKFNIEKVNDINKIMDYGVMMTPALVVDGVVKITGKVPSIDDLKKLISEE
jgi:small redox-active disulfide protein 2